MHGTVYETNAGLLTRIVDRDGAVWAALQWSASGCSASGDRIARLEVPGAVVDGAVVAHPLLGDAHAIAFAGGETAMTALAWAHPTEIPAIAEPGRLPLGAGAAILNAIAVLAQRAGVQALRYAGPYPTAALWRTLARSFRCDAAEVAFTADAMARALRVARDPIAIDFAPAPHERIAIPDGFVELRHGIERAVLGGIAYEPGGSPARLVGQHCEVWFGDAPYARVATLASDGSLADGPHPVPACESAVIGREFPHALRAAIGELVADALPPPLADDARALLAAEPLRWADLGARAAREQADGLAVHAALWERIGPLGLGRLALALAEALAPVVATAVVRRASR